MSEDFQETRFHQKTLLMMALIFGLNVAMAFYNQNRDALFFALNLGFATMAAGVAVINMRVLYLLAQTDALESVSAFDETEYQS